MEKDNRSWNYSDHTALGNQCCFFLVQRYVETRRGTLQKNLQKHIQKLFDNLEKVQPPSRNANDVLW